MPGAAQVEPLAEELCRLGRTAGLDAVGVCDARPFPEARASLNAGLDHGWDAGMQFTYRNPSRSTEPTRALPGAEAMVVGALRYDRDRSGVADTAGVRPRGAVARYAWQDHYSLLRASLNRLAEHLRARGWQAAVLVDDNSLVDRAAAVRAGIGWYGKNTNVLIPGAGSWFVLGSVVTDAPLLASVSNSGQRFTSETRRFVNQTAKSQPEFTRADLNRLTPTLTPGPVEDGCGNCRRCIDACPTGALSHAEPGHLDARKCLAWLVQAPGVFPREHRIALHDRMYGCDDCQEVCPVNRLAERRSPAPPPDSNAIAAVDVLDVLASGDEELLRRFGRWYIPERDPKYLRRNALIVLGNVANPASTDVRSAVGDAISDPDPMIRAHAVWAAARLGYTDLIPATDHEKTVQAEIEAAASVPSRSVPVATAFAP